MAYFLKIQNQANNTYLAIYESFYSPDSKGTKHRCFKSLGSVTKLIRDGIDDPIAYYKAEVERMNAERKAEKEVQKISAVSPEKNLGYFPLKAIMEKLDIRRFVDLYKITTSYDFDLYDVLSSLIYARAVSPCSKHRTYNEVIPSLFEPHDFSYDQLLEGLSFFGNDYEKFVEMFNMQVKKYYPINTDITYFDCTNFYFEIEQEDGIKKYGKSKEHRPNPIVQMGLFTDGDGIPLAFSLFPGNQNEQKSLKPLEQKILQQFGCDKFIFCSDAGLASENNRVYNHMGKRAFIVTQSIKKLPKEEREWALDRKGFRRISDNKPVDITKLSDADSEGLFYKDEPYTTKRLYQRLIITYSPKYAAYQKTIRDRQVARADEMVQSGKLKKQRRNPNDPARFVGKKAATDAGEVASIHYFLDEDKVAEEEKYDGLYAVCTDLLDDDVSDILKVSEGRWQIEDCFRTMKTDFLARPVGVRREDRINAHFLTCFLALLIFKLLTKMLGNKHTCMTLLDKLHEMNFADIEEQGYMPLYKRDAITDSLHEICGFRSDFQFITKRKMKEIQKKSKGRS